MRISVICEFFITSCSQPRLSLSNASAKKVVGKYVGRSVDRSAGRVLKTLCLCVLAFEAQVMIHAQTCQAENQGAIPPDVTKEEWLDPATHWCLFCVAESLKHVVRRAVTKC